MGHAGPCCVPCFSLSVSSSRSAADGLDSTSGTVLLRLSRGGVRDGASREETRVSPIGSEGMFSRGGPLAGGGGVPLPPSRGGPLAGGGGVPLPPSRGGGVGGIPLPPSRGGPLAGRGGVALPPSRGGPLAGRGGVALPPSRGGPLAGGGGVALPPSRGGPLAGRGGVALPPSRGGPLAGRGGVALPPSRGGGVGGIPLPPSGSTISNSISGGTSDVGEGGREGGGEGGGEAGGEGGGESGGGGMWNMFGFSCASSVFTNVFSSCGKLSPSLEPAVSLSEWSDCRGRRVRVCMCEGRGVRNS